MHKAEITCPLCHETYEIDVEETSWSREPCEKCGAIIFIDCDVDITVDASAYEEQKPWMKSGE